MKDLHQTIDKIDIIEYLIEEGIPFEYIHCCNNTPAKCRGCDIYKDLLKLRNNFT